MLDAIEFAAPRIPVYTNPDAEPVTDALAARDALVRQVDSPVRWHPLVERMIADGHTTFVEVGPGRVLTGLLRRMKRPEVSHHNVANADGVRRLAEELGGAG